MIALVESGGSYGILSSFDARSRATVYPWEWYKATDEEFEIITTRLKICELSNHLENLVQINFSQSQELGSGYVMFALLLRNVESVQEVTTKLLHTSIHVLEQQMREQGLTESNWDSDECALRVYTCEGTMENPKYVSGTHFQMNDDHTVSVSKPFEVPSKDGFIPPIKFIEN